MFKRVLTNMWRNIRRAPYQALAAILLLTLTIFVGQLTSLLTFGLEEILNYFETRPQVTAFFTDEVAESNILALKQELEKQEYVSKVVYVSKQDAYEFYKQQNKDDPLLLEMVTPDILPPSIEVSARSADDLPTIKSELEKVEGVDEVVYHSDVIDALTRWTTGIRLGGLILVGILALLSILVMTIVISMKVAAKRDEIATIKLLGATPFFIHGPFIFEGAFYGFISSTLAWLFTTILLLYSTPALVDFLGEIPLLPLSFMPILLVWVISAGVAVWLGMITGSVVSSRFGK
jgi:cell division transport system permease protein